MKQGSLCVFFSNALVVCSTTTIKIAPSDIGRRYIGMFINVLGNSCLPKPHDEGHQSQVTPGTAFAIHVVWAASNTPGVRQACNRLTFSQRWEESNLWQDIYLFWRLLGKIKTQISWMETIWKLHRRLNEDFCFSTKLK